MFVLIKKTSRLSDVITSRTRG